MLMHPALVLFIISLVFSVFLVLSANSWFIIWAGLEMNVVVFIPLILLKNNKYSNEACVKYFLVQAFASILIISGALLSSCNFSEGEYLLVSGVLLKSGSAPFHQWLPSLVEGVSWSCLMILFILQKMGPLVCLSFLLKEYKDYTLIYVSIFSCALIGSTGGLMSASLRKIMAYSSIAHLSWVISSMLVGDLTWVGYYLIYSLVLFSVVKLFMKEDVFSLNGFMACSNKSRVLMGVSLLSLGGLPPFSGFVPKFVVSISLLQCNSYFIFIVLLSGTFLSLFFYTRIVVSSLMVSSKINSATSFSLAEEKSSWLNLVGLVVPSAVFFVLLNFKLFKLLAFKA